LLNLDIHSDLMPLPAVGSEGGRWSL